MTKDKLRVGIVGGFQIGKSTFVNCLLDDKVAKTGGEGIAVTAIPTRYTFGNIQQVGYTRRGEVVHTCRLHQFLADDKIAAEVDEVVVSLWKPILKHIDIIDTPGFKANDKDTRTTNEAINTLDLVVVLLNNKGLDMLETNLFKYLYQIGKPFIVVMNCINSGGVLWDPQSEANRPILNDVLNRIKAIGVKPIFIDNKPILICNLMWHWYASEHYLSDTPQQVQQIEMHTEFFMKNILRMPRITYDEIAKRSHFDIIRDTFDSESFWGFPLNYIKWSTSLSLQLARWEESIVQAIHKL